jgi:hypothetical protein
VLTDGGGGGGRFVMLGNARSGGVGLGCVELEVTGSIGRREVGRVTWAGRTCARSRLIGHAEFS